MNKCTVCGKILETSDNTSNVCSVCKCNMNFYNPTGYNHGWVCPKCGSVYSPSVMECFRCSAPYKVMCTN